MGGMRLSELDFVRLLPAFMRGDPAVKALSRAMNQLLTAPCQRLDTIRTWDKIDELNEAECDELAWELDIDWYDSTGMSLEEKRATIKEVQQIKRKRGTKWAVERLISSHLGEGYIVEWYETGGTPYTFAVLTTNTHITAADFDKFVAAANIAKNERSHIDGVFYFWQQGPEQGIECAPGASLHRYDFRKCGTKHRIATVGATAKASVETEPAATHAVYNFPKCGTQRCAGQPTVAVAGIAIVGITVAG